MEEYSSSGIKACTLPEIPEPDAATAERRDELFGHMP
jgi:hypothetical protein